MGYTRSHEWGEWFYGADVIRWARDSLREMTSRLEGLVIITDGVDTFTPSWPCRANSGLVSMLCESLVDVLHQQFGQLDPSALFEAQTMQP